MYLHTICEDEIIGREVTAGSLSDDLNTFLILQISNKLLCKFYFMLVYSVIKRLQGFPGGAVVENLPANAGDTGSSPGLGRSHMPRSN